MRVRKERPAGRYLRTTKAIEELIPWLYLKGVSTGGFREALQTLVGPQVAGAERCQAAAGGHCRHSLHQ